MPTVDSPQATRKAVDALILTRIWGGFIALCHLGGLAGALVPLVLPATRTSAWHIGTTSVGVGHHIAALVAAVMLLVGLRSARFALLLTIALSIAHCVSLFSDSAVAAVVGFGFGLFLYVPPLVLIQWRPHQFR
jgi:hypothetical protein